MKKISLLIVFMIGSMVFGQVKNTLLERSFWKKDTDIAKVKTEIEKGNNPSQLDANAFDPVTMAIMAGTPDETIKFLLEQKGNEIDKRTHDSRTYLHWAAFSGNLNMVNYLISKGFDINITDSRGMSPLAFAAERSQIDANLCEAFFKAGVDPKQKYKNGETLLFIAISNDKADLELTNYLIFKGMSLYDTDKNGNSVFDYATKKGNIPLLENLIKKGVKPTPNAIIFAAQGARRFANSLNVYEYLVNDLKLKANFVNNEGKNALHYIVTKENQQEVIKFFLSKKIAVNQVDKEGNTPFMIAASTKYLAYLQLLLPQLKNINLTNNEGKSALTNAIEFSDAEVVTFLLKNKANVLIKDKNENTLAYYLIASYQAQNEAAFDKKRNLLAEKNVDFTAPQKDKNTLLHIVASQNNLALLQKISDFKIDVNAKNNVSETALHKAAMVAKNDAILKYLLSQGANKSEITELGETAYDLAKENEILQRENIDIEFLK